jgi:cytochrome P450
MHTSVRPTALDEPELLGPPQFNPFDPSLRADPYPLYRRLREEAPIGQVPGIGIWYCTRFADCQAILRDRRMSSDTRNSDVYRGLIASGVLRLPESLREDRSFLYLDPPDHTRLRRLVASAFTPAVVHALRPRIRQIVDELLDAAERRGQLDIVSDVAYPLPFRIMCELLGIAIKDYDRFRAWSEELVGSMDLQLGAPPEKIERQAAAINEATDYLAEHIAERRGKPGDDLLTALFAAEDAGDKLTEEELLGTVILLFGAGMETTVNLIGSGMHALLQHPDQLAHLRARPELAAAVVEEVLRWDPPTQLTQRVAMEDVEIGGETIPKGAPVVLILAAACRDEAVIADADRFDITRESIPHLAFGFGPHFCIGAPLARAEGEIAFATVVARFPSLRLGEGVRRRGTIVLRGLESLPVEYAR